MLSSFRATNPICKCLSVVTLASLLWLSIGPTVALAETITIPAGTIVTLRTNSPITPEAMNIGDQVNLTVVNDVTVDGKVVIAAGATARGEVVAAKTRNMIGIPAEIGLSLKSVQAVDGTTVALYASRVAKGKSKMAVSIGLSLICCLLFALMKGGDATIPSGTQIDAEVAGTTRVNAD